uniref:DUF4442 domain-containing protein n=1 Tax=Rheinheimera sp. TaxID=1869214 RepID=UPI004048D074
MKWAFKPSVMRRLLNFWPPFLFTGIRVAQLCDDYRYCKVELKSRPWTRNINNSQFGGAMFAMTDPIYPLLLMGALGKEYLVWDKQADINFISPGYGKLVAEFWLSDATIDAVKTATEDGSKHFPQFLVHIKDGKGKVVCEVNRTVYVRKKAQYRPD